MEDVHMLLYNRPIIGSLINLYDPARLQKVLLYRASVEPIVSCL